MKWSNIKSDVSIIDVSNLFKKVGWFNAIKLIDSSLHEPIIFIKKSCKDKISNHLKSSNKELGGLLIGKTYALPYNTKHDYPFISFITDAVVSQKVKNTACSLEMGTEIWNKAKPVLKDDKIIIGWYHSHPNIGAFFSGTDRTTQAAFFCNAFSVSVVVDPFVNEWKCYLGPQATELKSALRDI